MLLKNIAFEHTKEKSLNFTLSMVKASPEKLDLGWKGKKEFARWVRRWGPPRQKRVLFGIIKLEKASRYIHSTFPVIQTNLDRSMSYIFLKIKICVKGSHVEFDLPFLVKDLAMKLQTMVGKLQKNILQSAFLLIHHLFTLK